jgi:hypothetical protein
LYSNTTGTSSTSVGSRALFNNTTGSANTAIGYFSLRDNTTGGGNTATGYVALSKNTTGNANTANGIYALENNTTGNNNTALGQSALEDNTVGGNNTAVGLEALRYNTAGGRNTSVGDYSMLNNTTGSLNTAFGGNALSSNTTGEYNVALGTYALHKNTTGSYNIAIGNVAGSDTIPGDNIISNNSIFIGHLTEALANNQTNQIVIGHNAKGNGSNTVTIGNDSITNTYLKGMVNAPNSVSILKKSDGFGGFTSNYLFLETGTSTTTSGVDGISLLSKPSARALNVRYDIGGVTYGAELNADLLDNSRTYQFPNASGTFALTSNLSAYLPLAGGTLTGALNGTSASFKGILTIGESLVENGIINSPEGIYINADSDASGGSNDIVFGKGRTSTSGGTTFMTIKNAGNVGIGTASPVNYTNYRSLHVSGATSTSSAILYLTNSTETIRGLFFAEGSDQRVTIGSQSDHPFTFVTNDTERMRITSGGEVLINRQTSSGGSLRVLDFLGNAYSGGSGSGYFWEDRSNSANYYGWYSTSNTIFLFNGSANAASINPATGIYTPLSDVNKKKDFEDSLIGLEAVLGLKPTLYRMQSDESKGEKELGFIAQEVKEFIPQAYVESGEEDAKFIGLNYNAIVAALVKSVQELKTEIDSLKNQIK